jgi:hypothetical protein
MRKAIGLFGLIAFLIGQGAVFGRAVFVSFLNDTTNYPIVYQYR